MLEDFAERMEAKFETFLTDTHAHLLSSRFREDLDGVLRRAATNGIGRIVSISCDFEDSRDNLALAGERDGIFATAGIHPCYVHEPGPDGWREGIRALARDPAVVAIGEIGLDHYHPPEDGSELRDWRRLQEQVFEEMLQLALDLDRPAVIHSRECTSAALDVLDRFPGVVAVLHCFGGTLAEAERALEAGHYLSYTGVLTYPKAEEVRTTAAVAPLDRILVETDAPYLAPVPFRGKSSEPAMVRNTALRLAELRGLALDEIASITSDNAARFFRLAGPLLPNA